MGIGSSAATHRSALLRDDAPGLFVYRLDFRSEMGVEKNRIGVVGLLDAEEDPTSRTWALQETEHGGVESRREAIIAGGLQEHLVVGCVEDPAFQLESLLQQVQLRGPPAVDLPIPAAGERHRTWKIDALSEVAAVRTFLRGRDCILIDGLHAHRASRRLATERGLPHRPLAMILNLLDVGLSLSSAALVVRTLPGFRVNDLVMRLVGDFESRSYPFGCGVPLAKALADFREDFRVHGHAEGALGACFAGLDQFFLFHLRDPAMRDGLFLPDVPTPLRDFDSVLLRTVILERYLGRGVATADPPECCWSLEEAVAEVRAGRRAAAFFLNPPPKRRLFPLARSGHRLPPGSLRIDPALRTRLVACAAR